MSRFLFQVFPASGVPIYRQLTEQVRLHAAASRLKSGEFLPSVRQVAQELQINPMTVSKAYSILERDGGRGERSRTGNAAKSAQRQRRDSGKASRTQAAAGTRGGDGLSALSIAKRRIAIARTHAGGPQS